MADRIVALQAMLARGQDSALLRFSLGNELLTAGDSATAAGHLRQAVTMDPDYSAAWKLYGQSLAAAGDDDAAVQAYRTGIDVAERKGDRQAAREMGVFLRRLERKAGDR